MTAADPGSAGGDDRDDGSSTAPDGEGGSALPDGVAVRRAAADDLAAVLRVVEGALLAVDADRVRERIAAGEVLVAATGAGTVVGALVRDGERVLAVAVARRRRGRGIGRALVARALGATGRLTAAFDPRVRGFYEALGFSVREGPPDRGPGTDRAADPTAGDARPAPAGNRDGGDRRDPGRDDDRDDRLWGVRTE